MKNKFQVFGQEKATMVGRQSYDKKSSNSGEKHNRCVIVPSTTDMIAEAIERKDNKWYDIPLKLLHLLLIFLIFWVICSSAEFLMFAGLFGQKSQVI